MGYEQITNVSDQNARDYLTQADNLSGIKPDNQNAMSDILKANRNLGTIGAKDGLVASINKSVTERLQLAR